MADEQSSSSLSWNILLLCKHNGSQFLCRLKHSRRLYEPPNHNATQLASVDHTGALPSESIPSFSFPRPNEVQRINVPQRPNPQQRPANEAIIDLTVSSCPSFSFGTSLLLPLEKCNSIFCWFPGVWRFFSSMEKGFTERIRMWHRIYILAGPFFCLCFMVLVSCLPPSTWSFFICYQINHLTQMGKRSNDFRKLALPMPWQSQFFLCFLKPFEKLWV